MPPHSGGGFDDHSGCSGHSHDTGEEGGISLLASVNVDGVRCLNESLIGSCKYVIKSYDERENDTPYMVSNEDDPEMIMHVPFTEGVRVTHVSITGHVGGQAPKEVKIWADREDIDFTNAEDLTPSQTIELVDPDVHIGFDGNLDYPLRGSKFNNITHLTLFFTDNFGADETRINYVGFKGTQTNTRHGVVECVYEARAVPGDHQKVKGEGSGGVV